MRTELRQRLGSAALLLPLVAALVWFDPWTYAALLAAVSVLGGWELGRLLRALGLSVPPLCTAIASVLAFALALGVGPGPIVNTATAAAGIGGVLWLAAPRVPRRPTAGWLAWGVHLGGAVYIGSMLACWGRLEGGPWPGGAGVGAGSGRAFWAILIVWAVDTGAYVTGTLAGRHKLWPAVSPAKTWEGSVGGLIAALIVALLLASWMVPGLSVMAAAALAAVAAVAAQLGDLLESRLKRRAGVKDSGRFMPGHGGVLDRLDSLLPAGPVFAYGLARLLG